MTVHSTDICIIISAHFFFVVIIHLTLKHLHRNTEISGSVSKSVPKGLTSTDSSNDEVKILNAPNSLESPENGNYASVEARNSFWEIEDADAPTGLSSIYFFIF